MHGILFSDQMKSHLDPVVLALALSHQVHMWSLVANSSHFLQPLDDFPFGMFKKYTSHLHARKLFSASISGEVLSGLLLEAAYDAEIAAFTPGVIAAAFKNTGLHPFDPDAMWRRFTLNTGAFVQSDLASSCRAAASSVIHEAKTEASKKRGRQAPVSGEAVVRKNNVYSPEALLKAHKERTEEREAISQAKKDNAEKMTCRVSGCKRLHRGGSGWMVCECGLTRLCEAHHGLREQVIEEGICICRSLRVIAKKQRVICSIRPRPTPSTSQTGPNGAVSGPCYPNSQETQLRDDPPAVVHSTISIPRRVVEEAISDIQQDAR